MKIMLVSLLTFDLISKQRIGDLGAIALFEALKSNNKVQVLCLDRNGLTDACCAALNEFLCCLDPMNNGDAAAATMRGREPLLLGGSLDDEHGPLLLGSSLDEGSVDSSLVLPPNGTNDIAPIVVSPMAVAPVAADGNANATTVRVMPAAVSTIEIESKVNAAIVALGLQVSPLPLPSSF